jgi:hypothetical protein
MSDQLETIEDYYNRIRKDQIKHLILKILKQESLILIFPCEDIAVSKVLTTAVIIIRSALSLEKAPSITEHISCI